MKSVSSLFASLPLTLVLLAPSLSAQGSDSCATAQVITGLGPHAFDNSLATTGSEGQLMANCNINGFPGILNDVWFRWTAPNSGKFIFSTCELTSVDTKLAVYLGTNCATLANPACNDDWGYAQSLVLLTVTSGQVFTIQLGVSPFGGGSPGIGNLRIFAVPTGDDACNSPPAVAGQGLFAFDGSGATTGGQGQSNPLCFAIPNDVWRTWTAPVSGMAKFETCGQSGIDTMIAVYNGAGCPGANSIACDDDACNMQSQVMWPVTSGAAYTLQIGGGGYGTFRLEVTPPPANDNCATPVNYNISGGGYDNTLGTTGTQGQSTSCGPIQKDLWFVWTASMNGTAQIGTCFTSALDTVLAVYAGSGCPAGAALACNNDDVSCSPGSEVIIPITAGSVYTIQVGSPPAATAGGASISIVETPTGGGSLSPFCFPGQSGVITCPCANPPTSVGRGCDNFGAGPVDSCQLTGAGNASIANDTLVLTSAGENNTSLTIFLQGPTMNAGGLVFGAGVRCVAGSLKRLYTGNASSGTITRPQGADPNIHTRSAALGDPLSSGITRHYFPFYRDPLAVGPCSNPVSTFNCGNAGSVTWAP